MKLLILKTRPGVTTILRRVSEATTSTQAEGCLADDGHLIAPKKAWDCGCRRHLEAGGEETLIAKIIFESAFLPVLRSEGGLRDPITEEALKP
jgi:hypothetical protein